VKHPSPTKTRRPQGGRPTQARAAQIERHLLDAATKLFLADGYGVTSMEAIARHAGIAKRTLYLRYRDKAALFNAVVRHVIERLRPAGTDELFKGKNFEEILQQIAQLILHAAMMPEALALQRLILAEAGRFPELAAIVHQVGARDEAVRRIAALLEQEKKAGHVNLSNTAFAAEQFLFMLTAGPQRRALVTGTPMTEDELDAWAQDTVRLFLNGCRNTATN
jgi:TetR/AcrR family transcriptional regulator, mexJK operon transcriptional repressor